MKNAQLGCRKLSFDYIAAKVRFPPIVTTASRESSVATYARTGPGMAQKTGPTSQARAQCIPTGYPLVFPHGSMEVGP